MKRGVRMHGCRSTLSWCFVFCLGLAFGSPMILEAGEGPSVSGKLTANGKTVELPYVYVYALDEGFYDEADPTWKLLFVERPIEERKLDEHIWDAAYVELGITDSAEFGDQRELQVYSQSIRFAADSGGNVSGGAYPEIELSSAGPDRFAGRVYHEEEQRIFDDTFWYDFTFSAPLSDPDAPVGEPLPAGGGEPGKAYLAWVAALHAGDVARLKTLVPPERASQFDGDDVKESLELMQAMTPTGLTVLGGSSDGKTAILQVEGIMDGETVQGEITLEKMGQVWVATEAAW